ncbi:MAG: peptidylprolyl isomerase [Bacteroidales bacterium]|nr:peptidylprolyl isomerase [Bacteroidales bacterium]
MNIIKKALRITAIAAAIITLSSTTSRSQQLVDEISAIVGDETILLSEIESLVLTQRSMGDRTPAERLRCEILEDMMVQKLFLDQARIDSIQVTDDDVDRSLNMRLNDFIVRAGSEKNLEEYYNKSMIEIRRDLRKMMKNELLTSQMQQTLAMDIKTSPSEVKKFYNSHNPDSMPLIPAKVELSILQIDPPGNEENKLETRQRLLDLRRRIIEGESFKALAILYSEDEGTAAMGGELGFTTRGSLDKAYADEAFSLKTNIVSRVVESQFGFHIIELIERNGDMINTRHILMRPKVKPEQRIEAMNRLDSIATLIRNDSLTFAQASWKFSSDTETRMNGGKFVSPDSRENLIEIDKLPPATYQEVRNLQVGEISNPFMTTDSKGNTVFRIVRLDRQTEPHIANLKDDYSFLEDATLMQKRSKIYQKWIEEKMQVTYIRISDRFKTCNFATEGWQN